MRTSALAKRPKSKIIKHGYINLYSEPTPAEKRALSFKEKYKKHNSNWNDTLVILCILFKKVLRGSTKNRSRRSVAVLDAGCGHGNYVIDEFRQKIGWACGVDSHKINTKKNICLDEIKHADLTKIPYQNDSFDSVLSLWVIEHLENPEKVFEEIFRVLKPGGVFIFATPNKECFLISFKRFLDIMKVTPILNEILYNRNEDVHSTYYKLNSVKSLRNSLCDKGFTNIKLQLNYDPCYTSFNKFTFEVSNKLNSFFESFAPQLYKQHIIGSASKPISTN